MESQRKTGKTTERHIGFFTIPICKCEPEKEPNDHRKEMEQDAYGGFTEG